MFSLNKKSKSVSVACNNDCLNCTHQACAKVWLEKQFDAEELGARILLSSIAVLHCVGLIAGVILAMLSLFGVI